MAKTMAKIENGIVVNVEWHSDYAMETDALKDPKDRAVGIGDTYDNGKWYRDGVEILTPLEEAQNRIAELETIDADKTAALELLLGGSD